MKKRSKLYGERLSVIEKDDYSITDAVSVIQKMPKGKFDESVEFVARLGIETKHSDQQVRGTLILPHGVGKTIKVVVVAKGEKLAEAESAGADVVGSEELIEKIKGGWVDFDVLITTPDMMRLVGQLGKVLGKRGLMPSPKTGTITFDLKKAIDDFRKGKVEYRADKYGIVHMAAGKLSFDSEKLKENIVAIYDVLLKAKPASAKGVYFKGLFLSSSMSPSVKLNAQELN
jgi:large subunit ribosomal protein L1